MYCQYCGKQINENAQFCPRCGRSVLEVKLPDETTDTFTNETQTNHAGTTNRTDRDSLVKHLFYMRGLEILKQRLSNDYQSLQNASAAIGNTVYLEKKDVNSIGSLTSYLDSEDFYVLIVAGIHIVVGGAALLLDKVPILNDFISWFPGLAKFAFVMAGIWAIGGTIFAFGNASKAREETKSSILSANSKIDKVNAQVEPNKKRIKELSEQMNEINKQWHEVDAKIKQLYDQANVVPSQYRGLYEVYFLHEYMSTSQEPFARALLSCDLDAIKKQLSTVIQQNAIMIENQLKQIALQDAAIASQEKIAKAHSENLNQINSNIAATTEAARIAASNAEACAWISLANYIKE